MKDGFCGKNNKEIIIVIKKRVHKKYIFALIFDAD
jgi:hypothetical protein